MAEYIEREALIENLNRCAPEHYTVLVNTLITKQPAADVAEVVRCKDCKHWMKDVPGCTEFVGRCDLANYMIGAQGYCLYGERRIDNGTTGTES